MLIAALALSVLSLAGCASGPEKVGPNIVKQSGDANITWMPVTPPKPLPETIPDQPSEEYVWVPGYWLWQAHGYLWKPGHWAIPPRPGAKWVPDKWSPGCTTPDVPGHWE